jgi:anaerobic magnesium-protoporphyrin IX monomethyl ester cyclase
MADISLINANVTPVHQVPLGPLLITAVLKEAGYGVEFRDYQTFSADHKLSVETFLAFLRQSDSNIIGISVMCNSLPTVLGAVRRLKQDSPDKTIILGGPAATDLPRSIMRHFPVDAIVVGEGELTIVELLRALEFGEDLREVQGICYRRDGAIRMTPRRARIPNLDDLPFPAYEEIDFVDYGPAAGIIITSRGCPFRCTFCSAHSVWQRSVSERSAANVAEEAVLLSRRVERLVFVDDTLVLDAKRVEDLLKALRAAGVDKPWRCNARIGLMSDNLLRLMAEHGCEEVFYGIESGSNQVLRAIKKGFTIEMARREVERTLRYIPKVTTSYVWGFPFETMDDFYETVWAIAQHAPLEGVRPQVGLLSPLPKSPIYREHRGSVRFSPELNPRVMLPSPESLADYPDITGLIVDYPRLFSPFYYYDHPDLGRKSAVMARITGETAG